MVRERLSRVLAERDASLAFRVCVLGMVFVAVVAAVRQEAVVGQTGVVAMLLVPVGYAFSYVRRNERNVLLKVALAFGLFAALAGFLDGVRGATSVDDTRAPLVAIFLWVQVLHSFDVPRVRDLNFSVAASVPLIALAGSLAFSTGFLVFVAIYAAFFLAGLATGHYAELHQGAKAGVAREVRAPRAPAPRARGYMRPVAALGAATFLLTGAVFVFMPRLEGAQLASLPFSVAQRTTLPGFAGEVVNPGAIRQGEGDDGEQPDPYFGYGDSLDLRSRGILSDDLVLRVRSPRPSLYRGQVFDVYDDGRWTSSDADLQEFRQGGLDSIEPHRAPEERYSRAGEELIQTFYVERELPNLVFHAYRARELFVPSTRVRVDTFGSVRLPFTLEEDTIYSVISEVPERSIEALRLAPPVNPSAGLLQYLELPPTVTDRFRRLALDITGSQLSTADKAAAVERWLHTNKRYRLDIPPDPPVRDPIETFVFHRDEGFCEQIATAMALMLRASGVPARLVTGFGPGQRNLFTGYWEVANSDAHAWVEVFYPRIGWVPYDPTFGVPLSSAANTTFMIEPLQRLAGTFRVPNIVGPIAAAVSRLARALPGPAEGVIGVLAVGVVALAVRALRRRRARARAPADPVVRAWLEVERALSRRGVERADHETVREFADRIGPPLTELASRFGQVRYGRAPTPEIEAFELEATDAARALSRPRG